VPDCPAHLVVAGDNGLHVLEVEVLGYPVHHPVDYPPEGLIRDVEHTAGPG